MHKTAVIPHVLTALSTPEGLPWMIFSPMNAHLLISSISSLHQLQHKQNIFTTNIKINIKNRRRAGIMATKCE